MGKRHKDSSIPKVSLLLYIQHTSTYLVYFSRLLRLWLILNENFTVNPWNLASSSMTFVPPVNDSSFWKMQVDCAGTLFSTIVYGFHVYAICICPSSIWLVPGSGASDEKVIVGKYSKLKGSLEEQKLTLIQQCIEKYNPLTPRSAIHCSKDSPEKEGYLFKRGG